MTRLDIARHNGHQALVSLDQALYNVGGALWAITACALSFLPTAKTYADETLSSRAWRWERDRVRSWPRRLIDALFFWQKDHCRESYRSERELRQFPPSLR